MLRKKNNILIIAEVISLLNPLTQAQLGDFIGASALANSIQHLETDDIVAILDHLDESLRKTVLDKLPAKETRFVARKFALSEKKLLVV